MKRLITIILAVMIAGTFACKSKSTFIPPEDRLLSTLNETHKIMVEYNASLERLIQQQKEAIKDLQEADSICKRIINRK